MWIWCSHTGRLWLKRDKSDDSKKERLGERYGQGMFITAYVGPEKTPKIIGSGVLCKSCDSSTTEGKREVEEREVAFVQYLEVTAPLNAEKESLN